MRLLAIAAASLIFAAGLAPAQTESSDATSFATRAAEAFRQVLPRTSVVVKGPLTLSLTLPVSRKFQVNLHNISSYCARVPSDCDRAMTRFVTDTLAMFGDAAGTIAKSDIRVVVRTIAYVAAAERGPRKLVARRYVGDLWLVCVVDRPHGVGLLTTNDLSRLGLGPDQTIAIGIQNTKVNVSPLSTVVHDLPPEGVGIVRGDFYDSSRLLLHDDWVDVAKKLDGRLVVGVPATDLLIYGDDRDRISLKEIVSDFAQKASRPISAKLYRWLPDGWEVVDP